MEKRHFYECAGETLSWRQEWYTQPWFTSLRQSYDRAASTGAVQPPMQVIETVGRCSGLLPAGSMSLGSASTTIISRERTTSAMKPSSISGGDVIPTTTTIVMSVPTPISTLSSSTVSLTPPVSTWSTLDPALPSATAFPVGLATSSNTCAGDWDWQAWGMTGSLGLGLIIGIILWILWAVLRRRLPAVYSGRTWYLPTECSRPTTIFGFLLPFLHLPSLSSLVPLSEGVLALHSMLAVLKMAALTSLLALTVALPLFMAGTPCLNSTSPSNKFGGRLGSLTDMSILRLLDSLDPDSTSATTSSQLHLPPYIRALPSTVAPAINSARARLVVLLVVIAVLACGGGLFIVFRSYTEFARYHKRLQKEICGGMTIVVMPIASAPAWIGLPEESIKRWFASRTELAQREEFEIAGVFGVPDTSTWIGLLKEREQVLNRLEEAEVKYLQSLHPRVDSNVPLQPVCTDQGKPGIAAINFASTSIQARGVQDSRFREINRDSALFGRIPIGQRVRINAEGQISPDPSPDTEAAKSLATPDSGDLPEDSIAAEGRIDQVSPRRIPLPPSPDDHADQLSSLECMPSEAEVEHETIRPALGLQLPSRNDREVREYQNELIGLNGRIDIEQQKAWITAAIGQELSGWVIVGRGVGSLRGAQRIQGHTLEDIIWTNVGSRTRIWLFAAKVLLLGLFVAAIMVPFVGLTVASAPGFAHYLGFLQTLADSDGLGSGVAEGLVPGIALSLVIGLAILAINRFAQQVKTVSRSRQSALAYKATFYLTLFITLFWLVTTAALEFAVQAFASDIQTSRSVGDGAIYATWFVFVVLLNLAVIVPGLQILQPLRLVRYWRRSRVAITPRQRFRRGLPPMFNPSYALLPFLVAVFYAFSLSFIFPLLAIPIFLLVFLGMVANRYLVDRVVIERVGYGGAELGLWAIRRFGWLLGVQPRWSLSGASMAVAAVTVMLSEFLTIGLDERRNQKRLSGMTNAVVETIASDMAKPHDPAMATAIRPRTSESSMVNRLTTLLPGYSRLSPDCRLPLQTEIIDDLLHTERASYARPRSAHAKEDRNRRFYHDPTETLRGLLYPPEVLAPAPVIWLPNDGAGVALREAADMQRYHGQAAIVDPDEPEDSRSE